MLQTQETQFFGKGKLWQEKKQRLLALARRKREEVAATAKSRQRSLSKGVPGFLSCFHLDEQIQTPFVSNPEPKPWLDT